MMTSNQIRNFYGKPEEFKVTIKSLNASKYNWKDGGDDGWEQTQQRQFLRDERHAPNGYNQMTGLDSGTPEGRAHAPPNA